MDVDGALRSFRHFAGLDAADLDALAAALLVGEHPAGHVFHRERHRGDALHLVLDGEVVETRAHGDAVDELARHRAGELFGMLALIEHAPHGTTAVAATAVRAASLPESAFAVLFHASAPIAFAMQCALGEQLARDFRALERRLRHTLAR